MLQKLNLFIESLKEFITENTGITNFLLMSIIVLLVIHICLTIYVYLELSDGQYHFYMNTKKSFEKIHNVKIDPYDGDFMHELNTEDELIRKQSSRFHLRKIFK